MTTQQATQQKVRGTTRPGEGPRRERHGRVVVGYDGSPGSVEALTWAAVEARARGASLSVLAAADLSAAASTGTPSLVDGVRAGQERLAAEGVAWVAEVHGAIPPADDPGTSAEVALTSPVSALVDASSSAELVVVGNRGHGRVAGALLGSVAFSVTASASCPVVVVRGGSAHRAGPSAPVVVGVDDSHGATDAVRFAADTAHRAGAPLVVLAVWTVPEVRAGGYAEPYGQELLEWARRGATVSADIAADTARRAHPDLTVTVRVVEQRPAAALVDASADAGLVVVGARGRSSIASLFLGSVSHATIHGARCPVAVVRRRGPQGDDDLPHRRRSPHAR